MNCYFWLALPYQKKKRRKKKPGSKDGLQSLTSDLSDTSLTEGDVHRERGSGDAGSDSESSASIMDEGPDPVASAATNPTLSPLTEMSDLSEPSDAQTADASPATSPPDRETEKMISDQDFSNGDTQAIQSKEEVLRQEQTNQHLKGKPSPSSPERKTSDSLQTTDPLCTGASKGQPVPGQVVSESQSTTADQKKTQQVKGSAKTKQGSQKKEASNASKLQASEDHNANTDQNPTTKQTPTETTKTNKQKQENASMVFGPHGKQQVQ